MSTSADPFTRFRARFGRRPTGDEGEDSGDTGDLFKQASTGPENFSFEPSIQASTNAVNTAFDNLDAETAAYVANALDMGITQGMNPLTLANYLSFLVGPQRAEGIARNEMLGAYRDAALSSYNDNSDVVGAWMWSAAAGACIACSEEDGTIHDLDEDMDGETHYACRCSPIPITQPWQNILGPLGIDVSDIEETSILDDYVPLSETFWQRSFEEQASILGSRSAAEAVSRGILEPSDFVGHIEGGAYDGALYTKSLREALADAKGMSKAEIADLKSDLLAAVKSGDVEAARKVEEEEVSRAVNILVEGFRGAPATIDDVNAVAERLFGRRLSQDELVGLVGAPPGSTVRFVGVSTDKSVEQKALKIELHGPSWSADNPFFKSEYDAERLLYRDDDGRLVMGNRSFGVDDALQGQGLGIRIFADQVQNLSDLGVSEIHTFATADGQYAWPRFGYVGKLPTESRAALREAAAAGDVPKPWGNYRTIEQLMRTPEGRAWWKANSESLDLAFDLAPNSLSQRVLQGYLDEKGITPGSPEYWKVFDKAAQTQTDAEKALQSAQSKVASLVQSGAPYDDIRAAKWEAAQAQAAVDAEAGGRGAAIFIENPRSDPLNSAQFEQTMDNLFGRQLTRDELGGLVGAPEGSFVDVFPSGDSVGIILRGPAWNPADPLAPDVRLEYNATRTIGRNPVGTVFAQNVSFMVDPALQGQGLGATILADQVETLSRLGVSYIDTIAGGSAAEIAAGTYSANGYYTWPRLGYVGGLPADALSAIQRAVASGDVPAAWGDFTTIQELMQVPGGAEWWKANGMKIDVWFDLEDGSLSRQLLQQYLDRRGGPK